MAITTYSTKSVKASNIQDLEKGIPQQSTETETKADSKSLTEKFYKVTSYGFNQFASLVESGANSTILGGKQRRLDSQNLSKNSEV